jgi:uncharacterized protein (TIGR02001 family)
MRHLVALVLPMLAACWAQQAGAVDVSAELGVVSDYRYRGFTLSDGKSAAQASVTIEHDSGAYATLWASTIEEAGFDADVEIDLVGGYAVDLGGSLSLDLSAAYFVYPSEADSNYFEGTAALERTKGPTTLRAGLSFVPKQRGTQDEEGGGRRNSYLFAGASYELEKLPLTLGAELGHERGFFDGVEGGGKWDWCLVAGLQLDRFRVGLAYGGTDAGPDALVASLFVDF